MNMQKEATQNNSNYSNVILLNLQNIAAWQINCPPAVARIDCMAELPALQRGGVWKVEQVEALWDSILQGFPLGAFLLSPYDASLGRQSFKHETPMVSKSKPTHMLLDGQQRGNGIALAFLNPWHSILLSEDVRSVLWVDLASPPEGRDVEFSFRVVTRAHPWGYSLINPSEPISQQKIRQSLSAFRAASEKIYEKSRPQEIPLHAVWPWDAKAPVPMCLLVEALYEKQGNISEAKDHAFKALQELVFMRTINNNDDELSDWVAQQNSVRQEFENKDSRLDTFLRALWERLSDYVIPANVVPQSTLNKTSGPNEGVVKKSAIETIFIRVNSAGTTLGGEELIYSLIKSAWIEAPSAIEKITHKLATPARTALLASRLVRARHQRAHMEENREENGKARLRLIRTPSVEDFRRLMHGLNQEHPNFSQDLKDYICGDGLKVFETAHQFLTHGKFGLLPVLASELAQKSPDVFFLFLCWLDRLTIAGISVKDVSRDTPISRRVIGFLTALAWFSKTENKHHAVDAIWHSVQTIDENNLLNFFNRDRFSKTISIDEHGRQYMIPVLDPGVLETALQKRILGYQGCTGTISKADSEIWSKWSWWQSLISEGRPEDINEALKPIFRGGALSDGQTVSDRVCDTWSHFMGALWDNKSMLLYVQREWIRQWFPDFDPSLPEFLEDKNRPWDFDHIHPRKFLQGSNGGTLQRLPAIITDWHGSIGNLRAWPLEANRSDGDAEPVTKLKKASYHELNYGITDKNKCAASFIDESDYKEYWSRCNPSSDMRLNDANTFIERRALVNAVVWRFIRIYRQWYEDLKLSTLV